MSSPAAVPRAGTTPSPVVRRGRQAETPSARRPESPQFAAVECWEPHIPSTGSDLPVTPLQGREPSHSPLIQDPDRRRDFPMTPPCTANAGSLRCGQHAHQPGAQLRNPGLACGSLLGTAVSTAAGQQDADGPNIARVYDYLLGGSHNFAADRASAAEFLARWPDARETMIANREFLGRAVRFLAGQAGIRQFLDVGSGIPTMGNVHAIAQQAASGARVVYVDIDEVAVLHSRAILDGNDHAIAIQADLRNPLAILDNPELRDLLDLSQPTALL